MAGTVFGRHNDRIRGIHVAQSQWYFRSVRYGTSAVGSVAGNRWLRHQPSRSKHRVRRAQAEMLLFDCRASARDDCACEKRRKRRWWALPTGGRGVRLRRQWPFVRRYVRGHRADEQTRSQLLLPAAVVMYPIDLGVGANVLSFFFYLFIFFLGVAQFLSMKYAAWALSTHIKCLLLLYILMLNWLGMKQF